MKIFISYNSSDIPLVESTHEYLKSVGQVKFWDKDKTSGEVAWDSIFKWIDEADMVVVIISHNTLTRAMSVGQEIGRAKAKNKTILPLVAHGVDSADLGCLGGVTYQRFDLENPHESLMKVSEHCLKHKKKSEEESKSFLFVIGLLAFLFYASAKE